MTSLDKLQEQLDSLALQLVTVNQNVVTVAEGQGKLLAAVHELAQQLEELRRYTASEMEGISDQFGRTRIMIASHFPQPPAKQGKAGH